MCQMCVSKNPQKIHLSAIRLEHHSHLDLLWPLPTDVKNRGTVELFSFPLAPAVWKASQAGSLETLELGRWKTRWKTPWKPNQHLSPSPARKMESAWIHSPTGPKSPNSPTFKLFNLVDFSSNESCSKRWKKKGSIFQKPNAFDIFEGWLSTNLSQLMTTRPAKASLRSQQL